MPECLVYAPQGDQIDILNLKPDDIKISDIARALSNTCRFGGRINRFYSVAEHSILVHRLAVNSGITDPKLLLACLLHDAAEAYIGDIVSPLKQITTLAGYTADYVEKDILVVIFEKFGLVKYWKAGYERYAQLDSLMNCVKPFDQQAFEIEKKALFSDDDSALPEYDNKGKHGVDVYEFFLRSLKNAIQIVQS